MIKKSTVSETITLRKINPLEAHQKYIDGITSSLIFEKININKVNKLQISEDNVDDKYYEYIDTSTNKRKIFTTNHIQFNKDGLVKKQLPEHNICDTCHQKIKDGEGLGIPIHIEIKEGIITIYTEGLYCSFEDFIGLTQEERYKKVNAEHNTRVMFHLMYPGEDYYQMTKKAIPVDLFPSNNGPLGKREIKSNKHTYINVPGVITEPGKRKFIQC